MHEDSESPAPSRWWLLYTLVWTIVGIFWATRWYWLFKDNATDPITWIESMCLGLVEWYLWGICALGIYWLSARLPFHRSDWWKPILAHTVCAPIVALIQLLVYNAAHRPIDAYFMNGHVPEAYRYFWSSYMFFVRTKIHSAVMTYFLVATLSYAILYYRQYRQKELQTAHLSTQLAHAELQSLKAQLHPHFLFNTLHSISSLMHENVAGADRMITRLSDLLRLVLNNAGRQSVPLRQELEFVGAYLEIEAVRFSDRLKISYDIEPDALDAEVPSLFLQPLIENAVRHGIAVRSDGGTIQLSARCVEGMLQIQVADDGIGLSEESEKPVRSGIGLANVRERLFRMYGSNHRFSLQIRDRGASAEIAIPLKIVKYPPRQIHESPDR